MRQLQLLRFRDAGFRSRRVLLFRLGASVCEACNSATLRPEALRVSRAGSSARAVLEIIVEHSSAIPNPSESVFATGLDALARNLVDPASSHMLVSKIKPCMSQYESLNVETANGSLKQL